MTTFWGVVLVPLNGSVGDELAFRGSHLASNFDCDPRLDTNQRPPTHAHAFPNDQYVPAQDLIEHGVTKYRRRSTTLSYRRLKLMSTNTGSTIAGL